MVNTKYILFDEFVKNEDFFVKEALANKIFVYPTDTIYGIGTIFSPENVKKINSIKKRPLDKICSVIAPDIEWIKKNYDLPIEKKEIVELLKKYHGTTFIFDHNKPGIRIIKHDFQKFIKKLGKAFITTSINVTGGKNIISIDDIPEEIKKHIDYIIDDGKDSGKASVLIDFIDNNIIER